MMYSYVHNTEIRVRYGETDQMGYCYYGFYAQYFEVGRVEAIRNLGMSYKSLEDEGIMLPVADFSVKYISPAYYDDLLTIKTHIKEINGARIYFEYELSNHKGKLIAKATTTLVFVTKATMRPIQAPLNFLGLIQPFEDAK